MKRTDTRRTAILAAAILSATSAFSAADDSPTLIPFQGRLTDQNGTAYSTGQFTVTFNLYDQAIGGTSVWTERHEKVSVINGMINAFLGSVNGIDGVDFSGTKFLGIAVDADDNPSTPEPEMVPRTMIIPAFFAKQAQNSAQLNGAGWDAVLTESDANSGTAVLKGDKIGGGSITEVKLADGAVTSGKIATNSVSSTQIAPGAVTSVELADGSITGDDVLDASLTNDDLGVGVASANLADEGLIALSAVPINIRDAVSAADSVGGAKTNATVYTVPAGRYAQVSIFFSIAGASRLAIAGYQIPFNDVSQQRYDITLGPGHAVALSGGNYNGGNGNATVIGVEFSNGQE